MNKKIQTLCLIYQHPKLLLGMKKRGFGAGRWNGFGGKLHENESIEEATKRELFEEAGLRVAKIEKFGIVDFEFQGNPEIVEVHMFKAKEFIGEPKESEEMKPAWFDLKELPFSHMWPDDKHWMPLFIEGKKFRGKFLFGKQDKILKFKLSEVKEI